MWCVECGCGVLSVDVVCEGGCGVQGWMWCVEGVIVP